jgi:2-methylcitrate dehydratase PrpD
MALEPLLYTQPRSPLEGKFSLPFCLSVALARRRLDLSSFSDDNVAAPDIRSLIERTTMEVDERVRHDSEFATAVKVTTRDGATRERLVPLAKGKPARWMSRTEIEAKYRDCVGDTLGAAHADELFSCLQTLSALPDLGRLVELAAGAA